MRSLEDWFKYVESFDRTDDEAKEQPQEEAGAAPSREAMWAPRVVSTPESDTLPSVAQSSASPTFRSVSAPEGRLGIVPPAAINPGVSKPVRTRRKSTKSGENAPVQEPQRETREQLLARLLDPVLTLEETAQVLNVCSTTVRRYTNKGLLQHYRTSGNQRRFRLSHVLAFLGEMGGTLETGTLEQAAAIASSAIASRQRARAGGD